MLSDTFRNNFEHFTRMHWSIDVSVFSSIVTDVCRIIRFLFFDSGNIRLTSSERKRIAAAGEQKTKLTFTCAVVDQREWHLAPVEEPACASIARNEHVTSSRIERKSGE
jgi:hypothetical protein